MNTSLKGAAKRLIFSLLLAASATGCAVYAPPYSSHDPNPYAYGYPTYVGPPVTLDLGFRFYDHGFHGNRHHHGFRGGHHGFRGHHHGFRGHHHGFRGNQHGFRGHHGGRGFRGGR
ncbi:hypothetical protein [Massilia cavernae]|uniref:hypothetical protein n=1 Tax=Massilia cavernae TaxID=2320864 RepID=UPI001600642D|nr:hypothetical protein [Massilia cavernae]